MSIEIRRLHRDDDPPARKLWAEAFGDPGAEDPDDPRPNAADLPGRHIVVADRDGELVGTTIDRDFHSWFGGSEVPTAGIAGVTVRGEARGTGLLTPLFDACLSNARDRGALISTMYPTAAGIYRRFGYEVVGSLDELELLTADLAVDGDTVPLRRATAADAPSVREVYVRWASQQHGPLTRTGPSFPATDAELIDEFTGITVAEPEPGRVTGYVSWQRGAGYGADARIRVLDLFAEDRASMTSLLRFLSGHASVAPRTVIRTSGFEPWRLLLRSNAGTVVHRDTYGLAVLDVEAFAAIGYPTGISAELPFRWQGAGYLLSVADGRGSVESATVDDDARTFTDAGIALAFAGSQSASNQRLLGHLTGTTTDDSTWDALVPDLLHIRDYF